MKVRLFTGFVFSIGITFLANTESTAQERGIDRESFSATFYDRSDLLDSLFSRPYPLPVDFRRECFGEASPFRGCKLIEALADGGDWSAKWRGTLIVPADAEYTFGFTDVDDGARLFLDGNEVMDNGWYWPNSDRHPSPQTVSLTAGEHTIVIDYEQRFPGAASLKVRWAGHNFEDEVIPLTGPPPFSTTLYMTKDILTQDREGLDHAKLNELGCFAALKGKDDDVLVILDFGEPAAIKDGKYGAVLNFPAENEKPDTLSTFEIREAAISFLQGYWECSEPFPFAHLTLGIGTKNTRILSEASQQAEEHGQAWAELVNQVDDWIKMTNRSKRLEVAGAIDIEAWRKFDDQKNLISEIGPDGARLWAKAYIDSTDKPYYDYGTCEDCLGAGNPLAANAWSLEEKPAGTSWRLDDWWYLAWGIKDKKGQAGRAYPIPEIYGLNGSDTQARQWRDLMKYALNQCGDNQLCRSSIFILGTLTQCGVENPFAAAVDCRTANTNTPAEGWQQLYNALLADPATVHAASRLRWSTDAINLAFYNPIVVAVAPSSSDAISPPSFALSQNYPNPFNPTTTISYKLATLSEVELNIYDLLGRKVTTLVKEKQPAGIHQIQWDGRNDQRKPVASGVYLYQIQTDSFNYTRRMLLLQ